MGRTKFKISNEQHSKIAWLWITRQKLNNPELPEDYQYSEINSWCESNLTSKEWNKLKVTIRARKLKKKITISIDTKAHMILSDLSKRYKVTLSELIKIKLESEWHSLPEEIAPTDAPEQTTIKQEPIAPTDKPTIAINDITLPDSMAEYNKLVEQLKHSPEWNQKERIDNRNVTKILKAHGVLLPDGSKISQRKLTEYTNGLS